MGVGKKKRCALNKDDINAKLPKYGFLGRTLLVGQKYPVSKRHSAFSTQQSWKGPMGTFVTETYKWGVCDRGQKYPWAFFTR